MIEIEKPRIECIEEKDNASYARFSCGTFGTWLWNDAWK